MPIEVFGTVAPGYEPLREALSAAQGLDPGGAQLAVYHRGVKVADLWAGNDPVRQRPFDGKGYHIFASATKGLTTTVAHLLSQRGLLDIDLPIAHYWPEFAQNGKDDITLRMVLTHTSGCPALPQEMSITAEESTDWSTVIAALEQMAPFYPPGTRVLYAPDTFGFLVGEVVRRITGKPIRLVFREEIALPLSLSLWLGALPEEEEPNVIPAMPTQALLIPPELAPKAPDLPPLDMSDPLVASYTNSFRSLNPHFVNTRQAHAADLPSSNGIGDARSLAKLYAHLLGPVDGHPPLLAPSLLEKVTKTATDGLLPAGIFAQRHADGYCRFSLGYEKPSKFGQPMLSENSFGHVGYGGRLGFADPDSGITVGYLCNNRVWDSSYPDPRWLPWMEELRRIARHGPGTGA